MDVVEVGAGSEEEVFAGAGLEERFQFGESGDFSCEADAGELDVTGGWAEVDLVELLLDFSDGFEDGIVRRGLGVFFQDFNQPTEIAPSAGGLD